MLPIKFVNDQQGINRSYPIIAIYVQEWGRAVRWNDRHGQSMRSMFIEVIDDE